MILGMETDCLNRLILIFGRFIERFQCRCYRNILQWKKVDESDISHKNEEKWNKHGFFVDLIVVLFFFFFITNSHL